MVVRAIMSREGLHVAVQVSPVMVVLTAGQLADTVAPLEVVYDASTTLKNDGIEVVATCTRLYKTISVEYRNTNKE